VFGKHSEKIQRVFGERPNIYLALCSEFQLGVKKKLNEGPVIVVVSFGVAVCCLSCLSFSTCTSPTKVPRFGEIYITLQTK